MLLAIVDWIVGRMPFRSGWQFFRSRWLSVRCVLASRQPGVSKPDGSNLQHFSANQRVVSKRGVCVQAGCPSGLSDWLRGWPLDALLVGVDRLSVDTLVDVVCLGGDCSDVRIQTYTITNSYNKLASVACLPACRCHGGQSSKTNSIRNSRRLAGRQPRGNPGHWPPTVPMAATSRTK